MSNFNYIKIVTAGDGGVGKTTMLNSYVYGVFDNETDITIGINFFIKNISYNGTTYLLQIWDIGGQERFKCVHNRIPVTMKGAKGALLMFDLTRTETLINIEFWINYCRSENPRIPIVFIGSKLDLKEMISVKDTYANEIKNHHSLVDYIKISSKTGKNIDKVFDVLLETVLLNESP